MYSCDQSNVYFFKYCNNYYYTKIKEYFQFFVLNNVIFIREKLFFNQHKESKMSISDKLNKAH
jgi:hypothetical protein